MSGSAAYGSMMIRNLRQPADYAKAVMTQNELLKVAISNDANIAKARQEVRLGNPPPVPPANLKTAEENALDVGKMESDAVSNILSLGFPYDEASRIVVSLTQDEMYKLNRSIPAIKQDFDENYDVRLITPTFFVDYVRKFFEELDAANGVSSGYGLGYIKDKFNELMDTTNELRAVIPTQDQIRTLQEVMMTAFDDLPAVISQPIMERLEILNELLPTGELYAKLDELGRENKAEAYKLQQQLQNALAGLPSRDQVQKILADLADGRVSNQDALKKIEDMVNDMDASQTEQLSQVISMINQVEAEVRSGKYVEGDLMAVAEIELGGETVPFGILSVDKKTIVMINSTGEKIRMNAASIASLNKIIKSQGFPDPKLQYATLRRRILENNNAGLTVAVNDDEYTSAETAFENMSELTGTTGMYSGRSAASGGTAATDVEEISVAPSAGGASKKKGKGLVSRKIPQAKMPKIKIGVGIKDKKEPPYRQLGKYIIHWKQLNDNDMLNVKYKSLGRIPQFKPIPVSDIFKEYLIDVMESGKHNHRHYENIPIEERKIWEKIVSGAGLAEQFKIKKTITDTDTDDMERFEMLKGQYLAGNNNPTVIRELRRFVVKFLGDGRLKRNQALDLLLELSV